MYMPISVTDSPANYRAILPPEDPRPPPNAGRETRGVRRVGSWHDFYSTREWISSEGLARWTYFLLGCSIFFPWNALTNGTSFFLSRTAHSPFNSICKNSMSSVFTLAKLFCMAYCTVTVKQSSSSRRIFASTTATIVLMTSLWISTFIEGTPSTFFVFALFSTASIAITSSYLCAAVYAQAALLGPSLLQIVISGEAAIAVAMSVVQVVSAVTSVWGFSPTPTVSMWVFYPEGAEYVVEEVAARIFFGFSALFLVLGLVAYARLTRRTSLNSPVGTSKHHHDDVEDADEHTGLISGVRRSVMGGASLFYRILEQNWIFMFSIAYVHTVTLAIYPAITTRAQSVNPATPSVLFTAFHFLVFNCADLLGRHVCSFPRFVVCSPEKILCLSVIRTLFIPLILLCNVERSVIPIINSDILFMLILFAFGYTNGFVTCTTLLTVASPERNPRLQRDYEDVDVAAAMGGTFTMVGLASGALSRYSVQAMI